MWHTFDCSKPWSFIITLKSERIFEKKNDFREKSKSSKFWNFWCPTKINLLMKNEFETKLQKRFVFYKISDSLSTLQWVKLDSLSWRDIWNEKFRFPNLASINGLMSSFFNELTFKQAGCNRSAPVYIKAENS